MERQDIELRSEKVRNIIGRIPPVLIRQGIAIVSLLLLLLIAGAYFIPYPETVRMEIQWQDVPERTIGYCSPQIKSRLAEGQTVRLELLGYPSESFGLLEGKISAISLPARQKPLEIEITLTDKTLKTSSGKIIPFTPQMSGTGTILLSDESLLKRLQKSIYDRR